MLNEIEKRQSIRKYKNKMVENEKIEILLRAAMNAPSARNTQEWKFIVITQKKALSDITKLSPYTQFVKSAPCAILVIADLNKAINKEYGMINCSAAIENMLIEAVHQGLGTCWCGIAPNEDRIVGFQRNFNLKDFEYPVGLVAIGYSDQEKPLSDYFRSEVVRYIKEDE